MMTQKPCFLCNTECESNIDTEWRDVRWFICPRCGDFGITRGLEINTASDQASKIKAAMIASERRLRNQERFVLTDGQSGIQNGIPWIKLDEFLSNFPKSTYEMIERALLSLAAQTSHPSDKIQISEADCLPFFSKDIEGLSYILRQMDEMKWINRPELLLGPVTIEAKGWQKVDELTQKLGKSSTQAFVAMWFDESMNR